MANSVRRALISVSSKQGIIEFSAALSDLGIEILSTGGTAALLAGGGIPVIEVSDHTGFPEMMDGRVKTLHPIIHGGILGRRGKDDDIMSANRISPIDLVAVNLYPFQQTAARPDCSLESAMEHIDIGGPAMLRAAAKNYKDVTVIVDNDDYERVLRDLQENGGMVSADLRFDLAVKAFEHCAKYDGAVADYLGAIGENNTRRLFPRTFNRQYRKKQEMRYGENPHQKGAFYIDVDCSMPGAASAVQIQGKALSYNNIADADAALECVKQFDRGFACVIVKHANPCGAAVSDSQIDCYQRAYATDPESAFGGIIAFNDSLQAATAGAIADRQFVEVIIAPSISDEARTILSAKENIRLLECGFRREIQTETASPRFDMKKVCGGLLVQEIDADLYRELEVVTELHPDEKVMRDLIFAWKVAKFVKSNAIVYAADGSTIGIGAGQMSRVNSVAIAAVKAAHAGLDAAGAVMASDAFFPFRDGLDEAADAGIKAVIQPGGSMRDDEVIAAANEHGMAMVFTGMRHFRH